MDETSQDNALNTAPPNPTKTYPHSNDINTTLSFIVPPICLLSCIAAGLAQWHTPSQVGSYNNGNLYQVISGSIIQLLGAGILICPISSSASLLGMPRIWTCVLAGTSIICTMTAIPLYLVVVVPTAWSGLLSFHGGAAQTLVLLQVVRRIWVRCQLSMNK